MFPTHRLTRTRGRLQIEPLEPRRFLAADYELKQAAIEVSPAEQLMIELVNQARASPLSEAERLDIALNDDLDPNQISSVPKQPLAPDASLGRAAELHSQSMILRDDYDHITPDNITPWDRAESQGYERAIAENIALNWLSDGDVQAVVQQAHDMLFRSAGHRANLMVDRAAEVGVGIEQNSVADNDFPAWRSVLTTQMFGSARSTPAITGVVYTDSVIDDNFYSIGEGHLGVRIEASNDRGQTYWIMTGDTGGYALRVPEDFYTIVAIDKAGERYADRGRVVVGSENVKLAIVADHWSQLNETPDPDLDARCDTNQDGSVTAADALIIINHLSTTDAPFEVRMDANRDGRNTASDALMVINELDQTVANAEIDLFLDAERFAEVTEDSLTLVPDLFIPTPAVSEIGPESWQAVEGTNNQFDLRSVDEAESALGYQIVLRDRRWIVEYRATETGDVVYTGHILTSDYSADADRFNDSWDELNREYEQAVDDANAALTVDRAFA
ncbi:dockerin type I domain-containing protein [Novipirellula herctigrandis]|uniref:dockerin type I domain-containing protein n=1 Tax=Novipirellula herctigrandis TaxID=2527986 RepID=UPI003AF35792